MDSKIVKIAGTENKAKVIRYFSLVNHDKKYICFINYSGKGLDLSTINLGYVSIIGDKIIVFKMESDDEWLRIKPIMENLFATGSSNEIVTYPVDNIERIDIVSYHTFDKKNTDFSKFFNVKVPEEIEFSFELKHHNPTPTPDVTPSVVTTQGPFETTTPVRPSRKKGSRMVIVLAIILLILAIAAALYYFKDEIFKTAQPVNNNTSNGINETPQFAENELVCTIKYNDNESNGIVSEKLSYVFSDDKATVASVKMESKMEFTDEEEYKTSKQSAQMGLAFASMFGITMNIEPNDQKLAYTISMEMDATQITESGFEVEQNGSYDEVKEQALVIGYTCNGDSKEYNKSIGNGEIKAIDKSAIIVNDGWRIVATADNIDENSTALEFSINVRHLNDSNRSLTGTLTTYDENKKPLSKTTISSKNVKGNSYFQIDADTDFDTKELVEDFDFNNVKYFSIEINK
ncbi:MAG: hypothetical protein ACM3O4_06050 [Ignavibacteriales bacterium]